MEKTITIKSGHVVAVARPQATGAHGFTADAAVRALDGAVLLAGAVTWSTRTATVNRERLRPASAETSMPPTSIGLLIDYALIQLRSAWEKQADDERTARAAGECAGLTLLHALNDRDRALARIAEIVCERPWLADVIHTIDRADVIRACTLRPGESFKSGFVVVSREDPGA